MDKTNAKFNLLLNKCVVENRDQQEKMQFQEEENCTGILFSVEYILDRLNANNFVGPDEIPLLVRKFLSLRQFYVNCYSSLWLQNFSKNMEIPSDTTNP